MRGRSPTPPAAGQAAVATFLFDLAGFGGVTDRRRLRGQLPPAFLPLELGCAPLVRRPCGARAVGCLVALRRHLRTYHEFRATNWKTVMTTRDERQAYERGRSDRQYTLNNPIGALIGGVGTAPSDPSEREAYSKGLQGKQLDADKKR